MTARVGALVRVTATALTALVLAHNLIFLTGYRAAFGRALAGTGHDRAWTIAAVVSLALGMALFGAALWRVHGLRRQARAAGARRLPTEPDGGDFVRHWMRWWLALTLATALLFVLQENLELARITSPLPGIGVLASAASANALLIIGAVALAVSFVAALLSWKLDLLIARIQAAQSSGRAAAPPAFLPSDPSDRRRGSIIGRRLAGRAPPIEYAH